MRHWKTIGSAATEEGLILLIDEKLGRNVALVQFTRGKNAKIWKGHYAVSDKYSLNRIGETIARLTRDGRWQYGYYWNDPK